MGVPDEPFCVQIRPVVFGGMVVLATLLRFNSSPPLWWDEGWTLSVARTWVESRHYGLVNAGQPVSHSLAGHFPIVASAALSFRLFGIGALQGRLPFALYTAGAIAVMYSLGRSLYSPKTAAAAVLMIVLLPVSDEISPLIAGRQALGETILLLSLLIGHLFFLKGLSGHWLHHFGSIVFWALALITKAQLVPFWITSISLTILILVWQRQFRILLTLAAVSIGTWVLYSVFARTVILIISSNNAGVPMGMPGGLLSVSGFVPNLAIRLTNLQSVITFAWWVCLGLVVAVWTTLHRIRSGEYSPEKETVRLLLLTLVLGWLGWYLAFGMLWLRYLFPVVFIGSIFAADALSRLTHGFDIHATRKSILDTAALAPAARILRGFAAVTLAGMATVSVVLTVAVYFIRVFLPSNDPAAVAAYIDASLPTHALIETYDPEVIFLSDASFHFPPDQVHVQLIQRAFLDPSTTIDYDPLAADPDYLLVGPFSGRYGLYDEVIASGAFEIEVQFPGYTLYARVAP